MCETNLNLKKNSVLSFDVAVSFRLLNVLFREIRNIRNWLSNAKAILAKQRANFSRNTKLVSHEIFENFVRKKLECQPYACIYMYVHCTV